MATRPKSLEPPGEPVARDILSIGEAKALVKEEFPDDTIQNAHTDSAVIAGIAVFEFWTPDGEGAFQTRFVTRRDHPESKPKAHSQFSGLAAYLDSKVFRDRNENTTWANQPGMVKFALSFLAALLVAIAGLAIYSGQTPVLILAIAAILFVVVAVVGQIIGHDKTATPVDAVLRLIGIGKKA